MSSIHQEEILWKQPSRITLLKEGESNTKFFHFVANRKHNRNFIPNFFYNGQWIKENQNLIRDFINHFQNHFCSSRSNPILLDYQALFPIEKMSITLLWKDHSLLRKLNMQPFSLIADKAQVLMAFPFSSSSILGSCSKQPS